MAEPITPKVLKAHCPHCGPDRNADVQGEFRHLLNSTDDDPTWLETVYRLLQCRGCENVYYQEESRFSEHEEIEQNPYTGELVRYIPAKYTYWPALSKREQPNWLDKIRSVDHDLYLLLDETYSALNNDQHVLAAIGVRTALDRSSELLGVDAGVTFAEKLKLLEAKGTIGKSEHETLSAITDAGSAAAHRGWRPSVDALDTMMSALEAFVHRAFVVQTAAGALRESIPERPKRPATRPKMPS